MRFELRPGNKDRLRKASIVTGVTLAHLAVFAFLGRADAPTEPVGVPPPFQVILVRPAPPPPPPPPLEPSRTAGGGAPAAPSRIHVSPEPVEAPPELPAPPVPAPEPALVVGVAPTADPLPGMGQGGQGTGSGTGRGAGSGPGSGGGTPPRLLMGPTNSQILREFPRAAREARQSGRGVIACRIRLDTRLDGCRLVSETPAGMGFGQAALAASVHFRFRPPTRGGEPVDGQEVTVGVDFGPDAGRLR